MVPVSVVDDALRAEDVEGLLDLAARKDEYSHEQVIASELAEFAGPASEESATAVINTFGPWLGASSFNSATHGVPISVDCN